jgi:hypothetical protein
VSLERFGYHSKYFRNYEAKLQDKFVDQRRIVENILKNAASKPLNERPIILVFRGGDAWENLLGENFFKEYEKVYFVSNVQNPTVSNSQLGQDEFKQIKLDWNALVDDETLHLK